MNQECLEKLREAANTKDEVRFGEQSLKRKIQLQHYFMYKLIHNPDLGPSNNESYIQNIYNSLFYFPNMISSIILNIKNLKI